MEKIAAVIVTFNRINELLKNINMLLKQKKNIDMIYVINNNSSDDTVVKINELKNDKIKLINLNENIGGAGGFFTGLKNAYDDGYDFIVLMDDDGRPYDDNTIDVLYKYAINHKDEKLMINSLVFDNSILSFGLAENITTFDDAQKKSINGIIENKINPFNGTLVNSKLVSEIGFPNADFFIKGDESDYTNRAKSVGAHIVTLVESLYYHPALKKERFKRFFFSFENNFEAPWKEYYRSRNYTYMFGKKFKKFVFRRLIKNFIFHDKDYKKRANMIKYGYKDGLAKKLGKIVEPGQTKY